MIINKRDRDRIDNLIKSFLRTYKLEHFQNLGVIYIDDISHDNSMAASIKIYEEERQFQIRVYTDYVGSYRDLCSYVLHELTHLYLNEINAYYELLIRHDADAFILKETISMYEAVTHKLTKVFEEIYLEGI